MGLGVDAETAKGDDAAQENQAQLVREKGRLDTAGCHLKNPAKKASENAIGKHWKAPKAGKRHGKNGHQPANAEHTADCRGDGGGQCVAYGSAGGQTGRLAGG